MADLVEALDGSVADLVAITGQSLEEASRLLEAAGSVEAAVSLFFDGEAAAEPAIEVADAPLPPEKADATASSSTETSAAPRGKATATTWQPAATGDNFRRRLLVGPDAVRQLHEDTLTLALALALALTSTLTLTLTLPRCGSCVRTSTGRTT